MLDPTVFSEQLFTRFSEELNRYSPTIMKIAALGPNGTVQVKTIGGVVVEEYYSRLATWAPVVDDWCVLMPIPGKGVPGSGVGGVVLPISGAGGYNLDGPLTINIDGVKFSANSTNGAYRMRVTGSAVELNNQHDLIFFTGNATGEIARVEGSTGAATFTSINTPVIEMASGSWSEGARLSNSTTTYATIVSVALTLPAGTWTVLAFGGASMYHATASFNLRTNIGGTGGSAETTDISSDDFLPVWADQIRTGVTGGGDVTVALEYRPVVSTNQIVVATGQIVAIGMRTS